MAAYSDENCSNCGWVLRDTGDCGRCQAQRAPVAPLAPIEKLYLAIRELGLSGVQETPNSGMWRTLMLSRYRDARDATLPEIRAKLAQDAKDWRERGCPM